MRQQHAVNLAERRDGNAIENVIAVGEQNLRRADERGVKFIAPEQFGKPGGRGENDLVFDAARERHGVEILHRADAEFWSFGGGHLIR